MLLLALTGRVALAQQPLETDLHDFGRGADGAVPFAGISFDAAGNLYGTTQGGGAYGKGMLWKLTPAGKYRDLHDFGNGTDGAAPSGVAIDSAGNLYGTTFLGGAFPHVDSGQGGGMVWKLTPTGAYTDLHDFGDGLDGQKPSGGTLDSAGNLYGTAFYGGQHGCGIIWEINVSGNYTHLYDFEGWLAGQNPSYRVTFDTAGNLYGTAAGGANFHGLVWKLTASGSYSDIHDFGATPTDAIDPDCDVTIDSGGTLYGTANQGGAYFGGLIWKLTASGEFTDLHDFGGEKDGLNPIAGVSFDAAGNMYGTTTIGGAYNGGIAWRLTPSGTYTDLHDFGTEPDGINPGCGVSFDAVGNVYGSTPRGGIDGGGMVWRLSSPTGPYISSLTSDRGPNNPGIAGGIGKSLKITVNLSYDSGVKVDLTTTSGGVSIKGLSSTNGTVAGGAYDATKAGDASCAFSVTPTSDVGLATPITLRASIEGRSGVVTFNFTIQPFVQSVQVASTSVKSDGTLAAYVNVFETPATDQTVKVAATSGATSFYAATVTVPAAGVGGQPESKSFDVTCELVDVDTSATLSASFNSLSKAKAPFTISGPRMKAITVTPATNILAGSSVVVTAVLDCPKKSRQTYTLTVDSQSHKSVLGPISVTVSAGESQSAGASWVPTVIGALTVSGTSNGASASSPVVVGTPKCTLTVSNNIQLYGGITAVEGDTFEVHLVFSGKVKMAYELSSTLTASCPMTSYPASGPGTSFYNQVPTAVTGIPVGTIKSGTLSVTPVDIDGNVLPVIATGSMTVSSLVRSVTPAAQTVKGGTTLTASVNLYESYPSKQTVKPLPNVPITITSSDPSAYFLDSSGKPQSQTTVTFANPSASASFKIYTATLKAGSANKTPTITVVQPWGYSNQTIQLTVTP